MRIVYMPRERLFFVSMALEYYDFRAAGTVLVDNKMVKLSEVVCDYEDHWPRDGPPTAGEGGLDIFLANLVELQNAHIMEKFIGNIFGTGYSFVLSESIPTANKECFIKGWEALEKIKYESGPWDKTIGMFDTTMAEQAAITIQKHFRGWKDRMRYRYNPNTRLGRYCAMKLFEQLI